MRAFRPAVFAIVFAALSPPATHALAFAQDVPPEAAPDAERAIAAVFGAGAGLGMYGNALPRAVGSARVAQSVFPAFDVVFGADGVTRDGGVTPGLHAAYASSIGYTLTNTAPDGTAISSAARTHQLRVDAALNIAFGDSRRDLSLPIRLGYAWSNLRTDVELPYAYRHTLSGPQLGLRLRVPVADESVVLSFGPDLWVVLQVSDRIARAGLDASGFGFGGEAEVLVRISRRFALRAMFRETHVSVPSERFSRSFSATQRFITIGAAATY